MDPFRPSSGRCFPTNRPLRPVSIVAHVAKNKEVPLARRWRAPSTGFRQNEAAGAIIHKLGGAGRHFKLFERCLLIFSAGRVSAME
jgi:hypothetical protein